MTGAAYWIAVVSLSAIGIAVVGIVGVWWWRKRARHRSVAELLQAVQSTNEYLATKSGGAARSAHRQASHHPLSGIERQLLNACSGNRALLERLIRFELARLPSLSRGKAARSAFERLRADRRG